MYFTRPLAKLIEEFQKFPSVGPKSAQRMAFYVLGLPHDAVASFAQAILDAKEQVKQCTVCFNLTADSVCEICQDDKRDRSLICVVADSRDVIALERTREFKGLYHVLSGLLSPMEGKGPEQLRVKELLARLQPAEAKELILAINPTIEGDATVLYLSQLLKPLPIVISRIAFGLPVGADLEYADDMTLSRAMEGRRPV